MRRDAPADGEDDVVTVEELTELLAEAEGTTPEDIDRRAKELEIGPPEEAEVVGYGDDGPLASPDE